MEPVIVYRVVSNITFFMNNNPVGESREKIDFRSEIKAINYYKDIVWNAQGMFNNMIIMNDNFDMTGEVVLWRLDSYNERAILRRTDFNCD